MDNAQAIIDAVKALHEPSLEKVGDRTFAVVPDGMKIDDLTAVLNANRTRPPRRKGTVVVQDTASMIAICERFNGPGLVLFADRSKAAPKLVAVFNYHPAGDETVPQVGEDSEYTDWCDHRAVYNFPLSVEYKAWSGISGQKLSLADFASFLDDHVGDLSQPPTSEDLTDARFPGISELAGVLGGRWAAPTEMMALSRGLSVNVENKVREVRNPNSGEASIVFEEEHKDSAGAPIKVPSLFMITIPLFEEGKLYRIVWRIKYRISNGALSWFLTPLLLDRAFGHAFSEACTEVHDATGSPLIYGVAP